MVKATNEQKKQMSLYYQQHKEENKIRHHEYYITHRKQWQVKQHTDEERLKARQRNAELKTKTMNLYGGKCECCGETEIDFLAIDHVNGDGNKHRKTFKGSIYQWLKKNNYPSVGFRVLCHNCNMATRYGRICPHKRKGEQNVT